jgi:hypothetical protein
LLHMTAILHGKTAAVVPAACCRRNRSAYAGAAGLPR